ncbi:DUF2498 family protein [Oceanospirillum sediminis]|uniref:DUF2498 family protein n=1 Tax=Oceanospirillum sediminis TaxID=2760088 RepID=A0A839IMP8_9GAMM|nr:DUF2498 family protein [Oceanospirillum sediminis]MBB1486703.1 DUF2498 family protein [Oceanospirillum sediminis]
MIKLVLSEADIIDRANTELASFPGYIKGMKIESARMDGNMLVIGGQCFMSNGKPTDKTQKALEVYNKFAENFVQNYTLY